VAALAPVAIVAALSGCAGGSGGAGTAGGAITLVPPARRGEPVQFAGRTLDGARLDIATYRGSVVVLNVWGSWCGPCRKEAPELQKASQELAAEGVRFLGIDTREDPAPARAFQKTFGITYPSLADDGDVLLALRGAVAAATPITVVLDSGGRIAARISGATTKDTLVGLVGDVLAGKDSL
jgi:thiol-disulfide isomerase/thioredoxin